MTSPQKILAEVYGKLDEAIDGLNKWQRLYKDLQYKYNELASQSFKQKALAQPEQDPVCFLRETAWSYEIAPWDDPRGFPVYTTPPKREWAGLTDEEIHKIVYEQMEGQCPAAGFRVANCIEAKAKEKNHGRI